MKKYLIFDFNGTICDDVALSLKIINKLLFKYKIRSELTLNEYKRIFTFPVSEYYLKLGFKEVDLNNISKEWYNLYLKNFKSIKIYKGLREFIIKAKEKDYTIVILSACEIKLLNDSLDYLGIKDEFDLVLGINDIYANSKMKLAREFIKNNKGEYYLVGDTLHDLEIARMINAKCYLVTYGHNSKEVLSKKHDLIYDDLSEIVLD